MISLQNIGYKADQKWLLQNVSFGIEPGEFVVIMGMNGAGKSTLLKLLSGIMKPSAGSIHYENKPLHSFSPEALSTKRAVLSQQHSLSFNVTVEEVVLMGRYPYMDNQPTGTDKKMIRQSMDRMGIAHLANRYYHTLSGGEAQKVQMSRVLSQIGNTDADNQKILLLDEPVSHLDIKYQYQLLRVAKQLTSQFVTVIAVLHDINLATVYADRILFLKDGQLLYNLDHPSTISCNIIDTVFDINSTIIQDPLNNRPIVLFH